MNMKSFCTHYKLIDSKSRPKKPREYSEFYPETRRLNVTKRPIIKKEFESSVVNIEFPQSRVGNIEFPQSRVGNINIRSGKIDFPKDIVNPLPVIHNKAKRVIRQTDDFEHPDCAKCLDEKYMKHYYAKGCKPIESGIICKKPCPKYFECPQSEAKPSIQGCEYNGLIYNVNDMIPNSNECLHCRCSNISEPKITCAVSECFGDWRPLNDSCYRFYEEGSCCSRPECLTAQQLKEVKTCLYDGKNYRLGEKFYPKEDNCLTCICNAKWNQSDPLSSGSCKRIDCNFELDYKWKNREGCVPIYHDSHCCPIDYHCPLPKEWKCLFGGKLYDIGEKLVTNDNECLDCSCRIPPDLTCIKKKCDPKPADTDCTPIYESKKCCPTYNCTDNGKDITKTQSLVEVLDNKKVLNDETPVLDEPKLSEPCPPFIPEGLSCAGTNCTTIIGTNGCQTCSCEVPCPQMECKDPCFIFVVTPGECPRCSCP